MRLHIVSVAYFKIKKIKPTGDCTSVLAVEVLVCSMKCLFGYTGKDLLKGSRLDN